MSTTDKAPRATHSYINAAGEAVGNKIEEAVGISYKPANEAKTFIWLIPDAVAGSPQTMAAAFGARTLATNTVSAQYGEAVNGVRPRKDGAFDTDYDALVDRFDSIEQGSWGAERGGGGIGINLPRLLEAIGIVKTRAGKEFDEAATKERLSKDPEYAKGARANAEVAAEYARLGAKNTLSVDQL
jgi:hypothetical protein